MIDKITAGILYSYGYKLQDSEGNVYDIDAVGIDGITLYNGEEHGTIQLSEIGTTYKILARDLEQLTQEIDGKVPLVECAKIEGMFSEGYNYETNVYKETYGMTQGAFRFVFRKTNFACWIYSNPTIVENQLSLFQYLYSLNFNIGFPENTTTDLI